MKRQLQKQEDYKQSANTFKDVITKWTDLYNKNTKLLGALATEDFFKVGKCLEKGSDIFDNMMFSDYPSLEIEPVSVYFYKMVETVNPYYNCSMSEKIRMYPKPENILQFNTGDEILKELRNFREDLINFKTDLCKFHGKTKIRVLLDSSKPMDMFYFKLVP